MSASTAAVKWFFVLGRRPAWPAPPCCGTQWGTRSRWPMRRSTRSREDDERYHTPRTLR